MATSVVRYRVVVRYGDDEDEFIGTKEECINELVDYSDIFYARGTVTSPPSEDDLEEYYTSNWSISKDDDDYGDMHEQPYLDYDVIYYIYETDQVPEY